MSLTPNRLPRERCRTCRAVDLILTTAKLTNCIKLRLKLFACLKLDLGV